MDLSARKEKGENVDSRDIRKHKNDILRIAVEFLLENISNLPIAITKDMEQFLNVLKSEPFDTGLLKNYGVSNKELIENLRNLYNISIV